MDVYEYIKHLAPVYAEPERADGMKAYMKGQFEYYGISSPSRKLLLAELKKTYKPVLNEETWQLAGRLWEDPHREMQYVALEILRPLARKMDCSHMPILESMILTKSWWDTVDGVAPDLVGSIFSRDKACRDRYVYRWMEKPNIWLKRSAIIFQLRYGRNTDFDLLSEAILKNDTSAEFFVRKAQGWALRQYAKFEPIRVRQFVEANPQLSGLTKREALKHF